MDSPIDRYLRALHDDIAGLREGTPYAASPPDTGIDPDDYGICLATVDGHVYEVGTTRKPFALQSISKVFSYGLALDDLGPEAVDAKVDVEPSGERFNEFSLARSSGRPANAMINAGALAVCSLIKGAGGRSAIRRIVDTFSAAAGRKLVVDRQVYDAEMRHSDRNHALAYLLTSNGIIEGRPTAALSTYLQQCSVQVTCRDLSMMAATLANWGTNPLTGVTALSRPAVKRVLSVMMTSGMYDDAGSWASNVGMPAKSGVGGGTLAVLPGQAGVAVFSPPLDAHGGSVRGTATCERLSSDMEMHFVQSARAGRWAIRGRYAITDAPTHVRRTAEANGVLHQHGHRAQVLELGGDLLFAGAESVSREITALPEEVELVVLDVRRVDEVSRHAVSMVGQLADQLHDEGRQMLLIDSEDLLGGGATRVQVPSFDTRAGAVEHCEDLLLARYGAHLERPGGVPAEESSALSLLSSQDAAAIAARMQRRSYGDGDIVRRVGQRFGGVYFIVSGTIHTIGTDPQGRRVRLSTLRAGMSFGELSLGSEDRQETTAKAQGPVEVMLLTAEAIEVLEQEDPRLALGLWRALTRDAYARVDQYLREIAVRIRD